MVRRKHRDQLAFADFIMTFGGQLSGDNRWIKLAELIPWDELEDDDAAQFCRGLAAQAKPLRMALRVLMIKACLGLTDVEPIAQSNKDPSSQFSIGLKAFEFSAPFAPSMMVDFAKRLVPIRAHGGLTRHGLLRIVVLDPVSRCAMKREMGPIH